LVAAAAVIHAAWNRALHVEGDRVAALTVAGLVSGLGLLPAMALRPPFGVMPLIAASALCQTVYALALAAAYRRGALSVAYPIGRGTAPLLVTLGGWAVLGQTPAPIALAGAVSLACGLGLIGLAAWRTDQRGAVGFALLAGTCIAGYSLIDARAVQSAWPPAYLGATLLLQGVLLTIRLRLDLAAPQTLGRLRGAFSVGALIALGSVAAYLLVLFAFQRTAAGRVSTMREASVVIGLALAREGVGPRVWLGAALVALGAILAAG
jgi:drug/metabolite transporter (DMT)-like permease